VVWDFGATEAGNVTLLSILFFTERRGLRNRCAAREDRQVCWRWAQLFSSTDMTGRDKCLSWSRLRSLGMTVRSKEESLTKSLAFAEIEEIS